MTATATIEAATIEAVWRIEQAKLTGRVAEARATFRHAAALTNNDRERALLLARANPPSGTRR